MVKIWIKEKLQNNVKMEAPYSDVGSKCVPTNVSAPVSVCLGVRVRGRLR